MTRHLRFPMAAIAFSLAAAIGGAAAAQMKEEILTVQCYERDVIAGRLAGEFDETQRGAGGVVIADVMVTLFEFWVAPEGRTWSILATTPDGRSCLVGGGTNWQDTPPVAALPFEPPITDKHELAPQRAPIPPQKPVSGRAA